MLSIETFNILTTSLVYLISVESNTWPDQTTIVFFFQRRTVCGFQSSFLCVFSCNKYVKYCLLKMEIVKTCIIFLSSRYISLMLFRLFKSSLFLVKHGMLQSFSKSLSSCHITFLPVFPALSVLLYSRYLDVALFALFPVFSSISMPILEFCISFSQGFTNPLPCLTFFVICCCFLVCTLLKNTGMFCYSLQDSYPQKRADLAILLPILNLVVFVLQ